MLSAQDATDADASLVFKHAAHTQSLIYFLTVKYLKEL